MDLVKDNAIRAHGTVLNDTLNTVDRDEQVAILATLDEQALIALHRVDYDWPWLVDDQVPCVCGARWRKVNALSSTMEHRDDCPYMEADEAIDDMYAGW